jgi:acyl-CoA synthetase (AMP-forming)/AMP-acid ligase II
MAEHPDWATTDLSAMTKVFGKSAFARHPKVEGDTHWQNPTGYGLSETCAFFAAHSADTPRDVMKQSIGALLPGNELRIADDGELLVKGPTLMQHYVGKTPAECLDADGFFHTGDIGHLDDAGHLVFDGRKTEMIKTGGANVSPAELEVALRACEPVKLARIVGVPDDRLGERVVACIVLKDPATEQDIVDFLKQRVASYKVPKQVLFFEDGEIPMTKSDTKVRDEELIALVMEKLNV